MKRRQVQQQASASMACTANNSPMVPSECLDGMPEATTRILTNFAEQLGRLMARRELAALRDRRLGYGLIDIMLGAAIMAAVSLLLYRVLG